MKSATFDETVKIEYPDDFREMSKEELAKYFADGNTRFGAINPEKHIILSVSRTKNSLLGLFASADSVLNGAESSMRRGLKDYCCLKRLDSNLLGKPAKAIHFIYSANDKDVKQFGEMRVAKVKRHFYVTYCLSRLEGKEENGAIFTQFNDSLKFE